MNVRDVLMKVFESETNISSLYFTHCHVFYLCKTKEGIFLKNTLLKSLGFVKDSQKLHLFDQIYSRGTAFILIRNIL